MKFQMTLCLMPLWQAMRKTRKWLNSFRASWMKSANRNLLTNPPILILKLWQKSKLFALKMLKKHWIQTISLSVMKHFFRFMKLFMKSLMKDLKAAKLSWTRLCILCRSMLCVHGLRMSISVWTAEELMKSARLTQRLTCFPEHTVPVCLPEDRHRCFPLQRLAR